MLFLAQSDTTVGFLSQEPTPINRAKGRNATQKILQTITSFVDIQGRVPKSHRKGVRRAQKTTFVLPNGYAFRRVDANSLHGRWLRDVGPLYSSSANPTQGAFDSDFAYAKADCVVTDARGLFEGKASRMVRLGKHKTKRLR